MSRKPDDHDFSRRDADQCAADKRDSWRDVNHVVSAPVRPELIERYPDLATPRKPRLARGAKGPTS